MIASHYQPNYLGSVRLVVDTSTSEVALRLDYDVWGIVTNDTSPGWQPFGFAGGLYDSDTKLIRFGARDYDPSIGRWVSKDPILFGGGQVNVYVYVGDDPINSIDPTGQMSLDGVVVGAVVGGTVSGITYAFTADVNMTGATLAGV